MAVISPGAQGHPYTIALLKRWADVIRLDPNWKNGAYYNSTPPTRGLDLALQSVTLDAFQTGWVEKYGTTWADQEQDPTQQLAARYAVEKMLDDRGAARAATSDANHFLYLVKASQSFDISKDVNNLKAKFLFLPAEGDLIFPPAQSQAFAARLKAQGNDVAWHLLKGPLGHINGVALMPQASTHIQNWLK
jgi:homoserine O-acetyltransferase